MKQLRYFCLAIILLAIIPAKGSIKISIINGNWYSASTWSPAGVPASIEDTIIINSNVTINVFTDITATILWVYPTGTLTSNSTLALHGDLKNEGLIDISIFAVGDGTNSNNSGTINGLKYASGNFNYNNSGNIIVDSVYTSENSFINTGIISSTILSTFGGFNNSGNITVSSIFFQLATFTNSTGGFISAPAEFKINEVLTIQSGSQIVAGAVVNSTDIINDGDFSCFDFMHGSGNITGTTGKFCIANCFQNVSTIGGTVDICDASTGTLCDVNLGTIAPSVTFCASSPCITSIVSNEIIKSDQIIFFPNPVNSIVNIDLNNSKNGSIEIYDLLGSLKEVVFVSERQNKIDLSKYENGIYLFRFVSTTGSDVYKIVKN